MNNKTSDEKKIVHIPLERVTLEGELAIPEGSKKIVLFAHGSGSSRHSPRNKFVAGSLNHGHLATLLIDLLTREEESMDQVTGELRFDIDFLAARLVGVTDWLAKNEETKDLKICYFGASTGAAAALAAAAIKGKDIEAVVSRGGRPDLAEEVLPLVKAPTLLIVGGNDTPVIKLNRLALERLGGEKKLEIIRGATHLFEEAGALEQVANLALQWFS